MSDDRLGARSDFDQWSDEVVSAVKKRRRFAHAEEKQRLRPRESSLRGRTRQRLAKLVARLTS